MNQRFASLILLSFFALTSCKYGDSKGVKKPFDELISHLDEQARNEPTAGNRFRLAKGQELKNKSESIISDINGISSFARKYYLFESEKNITDRLRDMKARVDAGIQTCNDSSLELQKIIYSIGRQSYEARKTGMALSAQEAAASEVLTLFSLQYMKRVYETCSGLVFHYMNEFSVEKYDNLPEALEIRRDLLESFFGLTGMIKVISQDSATVSKRLLELRDAGLLPVRHEELAHSLAARLSEASGDLREFTDEVVKEGLSDELKDIYAQAQKDSNQLFAGKTLLFDPANPDHPVVHMLVVLSNLTWGSIQSGIGLGIILTHAIIITPASWALDAIFPRYFVPLRGPSFAIAENRMQIYVDVCGFPAIPSKLSLGIWELDFCTWKNFASAHEGGHAKQSALLGPLYLPAAILSYAMNGGHGGFIEDWADAWYVR